MESLFESIRQGISESIEYERGNLHDVKVDKVVVVPLSTYTSNEVREIRMQSCMTQRLFAEVLGVSVKTVEAWEAGVNSPSGIASRMLELLKRDNNLFERYSIIRR